MLLSTESRTSCPIEPDLITSRSGTGAYDPASCTPNPWNVSRSMVDSFSRMRSNFDIGIPVDSAIVERKTRPGVHCFAVRGDVRTKEHMWLDSATIQITSDGGGNKCHVSECDSAEVFRESRTVGAIRVQFEMVKEAMEFGLLPPFSQSETPLLKRAAAIAHTYTVYAEFVRAAVRRVKAHEREAMKRAVGDCDPRYVA